MVLPVVEDIGVIVAYSTRPLSACDAPAIPHVNSFQTASKWIG